MCPVPHADGDYLPRAVDELVPGFAAEGDNFVVGFEDPVRQPVVAEELPDVLDRVQFRRPGRERQQGDVVRDVQFRRHVPSGLVDHYHGMGTGIDRGADLGQVRRHGVSIAIGHDQARALALRRADRAEYVGPLGALVVRGPRPGSASRPSTSDLVLLADAGLVLKPQLYIRPCREPGSDLRQLGRKSFFLKSAIASSF